MIVSDRKANFFIWFKSSVVHGQHDVRRSSWIVLWADNLSEVITTFIVISESEDNEVPCKRIFWIWSADVVVSDLSELFNLSIEIFLNFL